MPGGGEILVILILVLLLFGPDKLPDLARQVGRGVRDLNRMKSNLTDQFNLMGDDETPHHLRDLPNAQSGAFSPDSRIKEEPLNGNANGNANANSAHDDSLRDEDDLAEDQADWRNCEEEPQVQAAQTETLSEPTTFDRLSDAERPAPPGAVARSSSLPRVRNDDESALD